jgi:hypothetical protein
VLANYDPRQWSDTAQNAFLQALNRDQVQVLPVEYGPSLGTEFSESH